MVFFITVLRAFAACLITNAHYTDVYPIDLIANGGLIGDILFFAVSGYCLFNAKGSFFKWYGKRVFRCYLPVLLITLVYMLTGFYSLSNNNFIWWYIYPTYYHFIASIIVLYIPYYFVVKITFFRKHILWIMAIVCIIYTLYYVLFYDKSYYHIDNVREPMIRFLFFESMLLGAWFKQHDEKYRNKTFGWHIIAVLAAFVLYFGAKMLFSSKSSFSHFQIVNQILIFVLLYLLFRLFAGINNKLEKLPVIIKKVIEFIAAITLEIYVVQYVIIEVIRPIFEFPLNWIALTSSIILAATILHYLCKAIHKLIEVILIFFEKKQQV